MTDSAEFDLPDGPGRNTRNWGRRQRSSWWLKYVALVAPTVAMLTAMSTCAINGMDLQTKTEAREQHKQIRMELGGQIKAELGEVKDGIERINTRIDAALTPRRGGR